MMSNRIELRNIDQNSRGMVRFDDRVKCPGCDHNSTLYMHLITRTLYIDCSACGFVEYGQAETSSENICAFCGEGVYYSEDHSFELGDGSTDEAEKCETCGRYSHTECIQEYYHTCIVTDQEFYCLECWPSSTDWWECDSCGLIHRPDCLVSSGNDFHECFGNICKECFYDLDEELDESLKAINASELLIREQKKPYFDHAKRNPDLSICCTHLIRSNEGDEAFGKLSKILADGKLEAGETGFFGKKLLTKAVCLTDLSVNGLLQHSVRYSTFGLAFLKGWIFSKGGAPALYIRNEFLENNSSNAVTDNIKPFVNKIDMDKWDFHHEREWRVPHDIEFAETEVFVVYAPFKYHTKLRKNHPDLSVIIDLNLLSLI